MSITFTDELPLAPVAANFRGAKLKRRFARQKGTVSLVCC
jgi:hypothetical protein